MEVMEAMENVEATEVITINFYHFQAITIDHQLIQYIQQFYRQNEHIINELIKRVVDTQTPIKFP